MRQDGLSTESIDVVAASHKMGVDELVVYTRRGVHQTTPYHTPPCAGSRRPAAGETHFQTSLMSCAVARHEMAVDECVVYTMPCADSHIYVHIVAA